ncbi:MAG TPA: hypothetical protein VIC08_00015 [Cellvibrionaceae bacterium]
MNPDKFDNWLQQAMNDDEQYLIDNGFTERVMAALPAEPTVSERKVTALSWMGGIAAAAVAAVPLPWAELISIVQNLDPMLLLTVSAVPALLISVATLLWGAMNFRTQM